jgi:hypothetical protein
MTFQEAMAPSAAMVTEGAMLRSLAQGAMLVQVAMAPSVAMVTEGATLSPVLILVALGLEAMTVRVEVISRSIFTSTNQLLHQLLR